MKPTGNLRGGWKQRISTLGDCSAICRQATDDPMPDLTPAGNVVGSSLSSTTLVFSPIAARGPSNRGRRSSDGGGHYMEMGRGAFWDRGCKKGWNFVGE